MSVPLAWEAAKAELSQVHGLQRVQRLAVYARIFAAEIFGTVLAVPFGLRAFNLHRSLPDARRRGQQASGTVSILRDVKYGRRPRNIMDIYLPPNVAWSGSLQSVEKEQASATCQQASGAEEETQQQASRIGSRGSNGSDPAATDDRVLTAAAEAADAVQLPSDGAPVVLFCHGGVWAAGSKWHYAPLATRLAQAGVITAVMQYTLYPEALVPQMVAEVSAALTRTFDNAARLGGSPQQVSLVGHSAGAHMCTMALLHRALEASRATRQPAAKFVRIMYAARLPVASTIGSNSEEAAGVEGASLDAACAMGNSDRASPLLQRSEKSWRASNPAHLMEGFSLPATPSKAKPGRRSLCSLTTLLVVFALVAGVAMFNQELGGSSSRTETYYRKALVAKMVFGNNGQTVTATSEEYSHSTVAGGAAGEAKAKATAAAKEAAGSRAEPRTALELDTADNDDDEVVVAQLAGVGATGTEAEAALDEADEFASLEDEDEDAHPTSQQQQQQQRLVTTTVKATATSDRPLTVTISATQEETGTKSGGGAVGAATTTQEQVKKQGTTTTTTTVTTTQPAATDAIATKGLVAAAADAAAATAAAAAKQQQLSAAAAQQQQQPAATGAAVQEQESFAEAVSAWWSNVIDASGERLPKGAKRERDNSASMATAVLFDEQAVPDNPDCKIAVMDVDEKWDEVYGAGSCDLHDEKLWPFAAAGRGIDGHNQLLPEQYQYSMEHWITKAIRGSPRYSNDTNTADFIFVDMGCYHTSWMAWLHPQNEQGRKLVPSPEYFIKRSFTKLRGMGRLRETKGGDFGMVHPAPMMKGLFTEEAACEDLASVLNMVPERSSLCVWTQDSHTLGKSVLLPYAAVSDIDMDAPVVPSADRETLVFFQGGCGDPNPIVRPMFAAGKMLRYQLVQELKALKQADVHAECSCDICADHMPHDQLMARMSRSVFCPIVASNTQSSRRLSEAMLTGCIPVFVGAPFHTLPLAGDVDYKSFALFVNVTDTTSWVNTSSPKWEHNHMISKAWKLDDQSAVEGMVTVQRLTDLVTLLRGMPAEEVAARHAGVVANRLKFWYPPASAQAIATSVAAAGAASAAGAGIATSGALLQGGRRNAAGTVLGGARVLREGAAAAEALQSQLAAAKPGQSMLGELVMRKMCHRAAAVQKRLAEAAQLGLDYQDSDEKLEHPSLAQQAAPAVANEADEAVRLRKRLTNKRA